MSLTGEERRGHKLKIPQPLSLYPAPIKKKRINRNEKNTHLRVFQEYVEYDWVREHAVLGRIVNKEWNSGFGLVTKWVSENYSGIVKRKASCSFIALTHSELQIFRSKAKLKFSSFLILIWILRGLEPNRYVQRYKQHHGKILLGSSHLNGHTLEFYPQTDRKSSQELPPTQCPGLDINGCPLAGSN